MDRLIEFAPLADARLDQIDEQLIEGYITHRVNKKRSPATVNRELATLRRLLYFAKDKRKIIQATPNIGEEMLDGERIRDFVLSRADETVYLEFASEHAHLRDAVLLALDTGLRVGELVELLWSDVHLEPAGSAKFGYLQVRKGKSKNARRTVPLTGRVSSMLQSRLRTSERVFPRCNNARSSTCKAALTCKAAF